MTREALLKASIAEFEDNKQNCLLWEIERVYTSSGFCYIIKKNSTKISGALHYDFDLNLDDSIGRYETNKILFTTRTELPSDCLITYKGLTIAIKEMGFYNETMGQWHYMGNDVIKAISDEFLITDIAEIKNNIGVNSYKILSQLALSYPIVPSFYAPQESDKSYVVLDITTGQGITPFINRDSKIKHLKIDDIKLSFVNIDTDNALKFMYDLQEFSKYPDTQFGINAINTFIDEKIYQESFNWRALNYTMSMRVNYYLEADIDAPTFIKSILYDYFIANIKIL